MPNVQVITAEEAAGLIPNGSTVVTGGFVGCGHPEALTHAVQEHFEAFGNPRDLTLVYAAGQGDGKSRGLNHFAADGLIRCVIGGHWNLAPALGRRALAGEIEAYNLPQGVISHLFREIAGGSPGKFSRIGLHTFVDPRVDGGRLNERSRRTLVELLERNGEEWLFYKSFPVDVALLRGTSSDSRGNISFEHEAITTEALSIAQAVKHCGGIVIVQVERMVGDATRDPKSITIPGIFVDAVVVAPAALHMQTFATGFTTAFTWQGDVSRLALPPESQLVRRIVAERAAQEICPGDVVNLGIGYPEAIAGAARATGLLDEITLTVESGVIGGLPAGGLDFGAGNYPQAVIDQPYMFDFYDGGGLDSAFLGMAECDRVGNVNVSKFGGRLAGIGGFMNITQTARKVVFTGSFTAAGLAVEVQDGTLRILQEGQARKFVRDVAHITFSGPYSRVREQEILYITERAVFRLLPDGLCLTELAPGLDIERDIIAHMGFRPRIADEIRPMRLPESEIQADALVS